MAQISNLQISYPDFKLSELIDPDQFDLNNKDIMDKVNEVIAKLNGQDAVIEDVRDVRLVLKADKTYVDSQDSAIQAQVTTNKTNSESRDTALGVRITTLEGTIPLKADKTYVDTLVGAIQSGYIAENSVTSGKLVDGSITTNKLANGAVTATKVDGTTVYTGAQVDSKIASGVSASNTNLQNQINTERARINSNVSDIAYTNTRIDNLLYNRDLYSAKQDIVALAINVEMLHGANLTGVSENMIIETLIDATDLSVRNGIYNSQTRKVYLP